MRYLIGVVALLLMTVLNTAGAAMVTAVRSGTDAARTRIVFDLSAATDYKVFTLSAPHRVVVDLATADVAGALTLDAAGTAGVHGLRYAPRGEHGLRLVLDVDTALSARALALPPDGPYGHRLVVDLSRPTVTPRLAVTGSGQKADARPTLAGQPARAVQPASRLSRPVDGQADPATIVQGRESSAASAAVDHPDDVSFMQKLAAGDSVLNRVASAINLDISGRVGFEGRFFFQDPRLRSQHGTYGSISFQPEFYSQWDDDRQSLLFIPFVRLDQHDSRRTHVDLRELNYIYVGDSYEFRAGVRKVFWGVAESNHLIDIINQTDFIENIDLEDKLGQPMVNLALIRDWGTVDLFVLPGFRERTFPGPEGRFQFPLRIATDMAQYESAAEHKHVDYAARYSNYFGAFDVGLYHFWGTSREPQFGVGLAANNEPVLFPIYDLIHQTGADVQATIDNWLFKFEALRRQGQGDTFTAAVGGFEYTFVGVFETQLDLGLLAEYHWDERGKSAFSPFNDDLFFGSRLAFNDAADAQILGGMVSDLNGTGHFLNLEASRRLGEFWKLELEMRWFLGVDPANPLYAFRRDDYIQLELLRYF